jgi:D-amino-acid dehydrogenase
MRIVVLGAGIVGASAAFHLIRLGAEVRVGFRPLSNDGLPLLGQVASVPGLVIATGLGPYGLTVGPYMGLLAAQLAIGQPTVHDLTAFKPDRSALEINRENF